LMAAAAITHDRKIYPKEEKNQTGKVQWDGSEAQRLLRPTWTRVSTRRWNHLYSTQKGLSIESFPYAFFGITFIKKIGISCPVAKEKKVYYFYSSKM
jgi:hypothetical protein